MLAAAGVPSSCRCHTAGDTNDPPRPLHTPFLGCFTPLPLLSSLSSSLSPFNPLKFGGCWCFQSDFLSLCLNFATFLFHFIINLLLLYTFFLHYLILIGQVTYWSLIGHVFSPWQFFSLHNSASFISPILRNPVSTME